MRFTPFKDPLKQLGVLLACALYPSQMVVTLTPPIFIPDVSPTLSILYNQILGHLQGGNSNSKPCPRPTPVHRGCQKQRPCGTILISSTWNLYQIFNGLRTQTSHVVKKISTMRHQVLVIFFSLIVFVFCRNSAFSSRVCETEKVKPGQAHHAG